MKVKNDDYGMMQEVLFRSFSKAVKEKSGSFINSRFNFD